MADKTVVLVGTLDTKGQRVRLPRATASASTASDVVLVDAGIVGRAAGDARRDARGGCGRGRGRRAGTRGRRRPRRRGRDDGARRGRGRRSACTPRGGSTRSAASAARAARLSRPTRCRQLPIGVPKLMVSTVASGDTSPYRRLGRRDDDVLRRRHRGHQPDLGADPHERRRRARGHGQGDGAAARRGEAADRRLDVRRHDAVR